MWTIRIAFSVFAFIVLYLIFTANLPSNAATPLGANSPNSTIPASSNQDPLPQGESESPFRQSLNQTFVNPNIQQQGTKGATGDSVFKNPSEEAKSSSYQDIKLAEDRSYLINYRCRVQLLKEVEVPALEAGQIKTIFVKENDVVQANQQLATLRDEAAKLQKEVAASSVASARIDAENQNRIKFAEESKRTADELYRNSLQLKQRNSIGLRDFKDDELKFKQSALQLDEAQTQKTQAMEKLKLEQVNERAADDLIERHLIKAACDGQVAELFVEEGEWVNRGDKVMRIIQMDRLLIDGSANASDFFQGDLEGKPVTVTQVLPDKTTATFMGIVVGVKPENSVTNKLFFEVEIQNQRRGNFWLLRPNSEVDIKVQLK